MPSWLGLSFCIGAGVMWLGGLVNERNADVLRSVTRVNKLKDLTILLDNASRVRSLVVTVTGRVGSESPIILEQSGLRGVIVAETVRQHFLKCKDAGTRKKDSALIVEETTEQHFLKHNDAGSWEKDSALMVSTSKEVPWFLDDGTGRVFVDGAQDATGLVLTVASEVYVKSGSSVACDVYDMSRWSLACGTLDCPHCIKMLGVTITKRILPTGTALTVIGEAIKDAAGNIRIQRPHEEEPFYVSPMNINELIANYKTWSRCCEFASMGFTVIGVFLLAMDALQHFLRRRRF